MATTDRNLTKAISKLSSVGDLIAGIQTEADKRWPDLREERQAILDATPLERSPVTTPSLGRIGAIVRTEKGDVLELEAKFHDAWLEVRAAPNDCDESAKDTAVRVVSAIQELEKNGRRVVVERATPPAPAPERREQRRRLSTRLSDDEIRSLVTLYGHRLGLRPADYARKNEGPKIGDKLGAVVVLIRDAPGRASYAAIGRVLGGRSKQAVQKLERRGRQALSDID